MIELAHFQVIGAALFTIGMYGVLARRSAVMILMSIELMLNAVNLNLIGYAAFVDFSEAQRAFGQVLVIFVITIAAAELALAVAIVLRLYRNRSSVNVDEIDLMKWETNPLTLILSGQGRGDLYGDLRVVVLANSDMD